MLTTPFVVRILLPAMREIDSDYEEAGRYLDTIEVNDFSESKFHC